MRRSGGPDTTARTPASRDPDPEFAQYAGVLHGAHGGDGGGIWNGGAGPAAALHDAWGAFASAGDPGWPRYAGDGRPAMIFAADGAQVSGDPFAHARRAWDGLAWQPGTWWPVAGVSS